MTRASEEHEIHEMSNVYNTKFLVVDDFAISRKIVIKILYEMGFNNIVQSGDGASAFQILTENYSNNAAVGFVISDWNMPDMLGIDFLKKCRAEKQFRDVPFLMITAEGEAHNIFEAKAAGATDYLLKPLDHELLKRKIMDYLTPPDKHNFLRPGLVKKPDKKW